MSCHVLWGHLARRPLRRIPSACLRTRAPWRLPPPVNNIPYRCELNMTLNIYVHILCACHDIRICTSVPVLSYKYAIACVQRCATWLFVKTLWTPCPPKTLRQKSSKHVEQFPALINLQQSKLNRAGTYATVFLMGFGWSSGVMHATTPHLPTWGSCALTTFHWKWTQRMVQVGCDGVAGFRVSGLGFSVLRPHDEESKVRSGTFWVVFEEGLIDFHACWKVARKCLVITF